MPQTICNISSYQILDISDEDNFFAYFRGLEVGPLHYFKITWSFHSSANKWNYIESDHFVQVGEEKVISVFAIRIFLVASATALKEIEQNLEMRYVRACQALANKYTVKYTNASDFRRRLAFVDREVNGVLYHLSALYLPMYFPNEFRTAYRVI